MGRARAAAKGCTIIVGCYKTSQPQWGKLLNRNMSQKQLTWFVVSCPFVLAGKVPTICLYITHELICLVACDQNCS